LVVLVLSTLATCGDPRQIRGSGTTGANGEVGDVLLRNVYLDEPPGDRYPAGGMRGCC
jgi:hypothetical protein